MLVLPFVLGIAAADALLWAPRAWGLIGVLAVVTRRAASRPRWRRLAEVAGSFAVGGLALSLPLAAPGPPPGTAFAKFTLRETFGRDADGCGMVVWLHAPGRGPATLRAPARVCDALPGARFVAVVRLEEIPGRKNPGGPDRARRAARRGQRVRGRVIGERIAPFGGAPIGVGAALERLRRSLASRLTPATGASRATGVVAAVVLGERERVDRQTTDAFARAGTSHLLAVSGLHVMWVFGIVSALVRAFARRWPGRAGPRVASRAGWIVGIVAAAAYAGLTGPGAPALRASAMAAAGVVALWSGRPGAGANALIAAAALVLALDPAALFEGGLVLSFTAVAGLMVWRAPTEGPVRAVVHASLAAGAATAPVAAAIGLPVPVGALLANLVAIPLVGAGVLPLGGLAVLGDSLAQGLSGPPAAAASAIGELVIRWVEACASPDAAPGGWGGACLLAGGLFALRGCATARWRLAALAVVFGLSGWSAAAFTAQPAPARLDIVALDVGHGDAILVRRGDRALLIDGGPRFSRWDAGRAVVAPALRALHVVRLDALVATHADRDHIGGLSSVLASVEVGELWMSRTTYEDAAARGLRRAAARRGVTLRIVARHDRLLVGEMAVSVHWPPRGPSRATSRNDHSLVLDVAADGDCVLFPGDVPRAIEVRIAGTIPRCGVLVAAHHGSATSSSGTWLDAVAPHLAIVSSGVRARAPLPHPRVLERLVARDVSVWQTARVGAVRVQRTSRGWLAAASEAGRRRAPRAPEPATLPRWLDVPKASPARRGDSPEKNTGGG